MKKIVLPIDGSTRSQRTIAITKQIFHGQDAEITLLMVLPEPRYTDAQADPLQPRPAAKAGLRGHLHRPQRPVLGPDRHAGRCRVKFHLETDQGPVRLDGACFCFISA